ncbi:carbohydrate sulfotransferase 8 isoform 3-T3 [Syngnathus typhle]
MVGKMGRMSLDSQCGRRRTLSCLFMFLLLLTAGGLLLFLQHLDKSETAPRHSDMKLDGIVQQSREDKERENQDPQHWRKLLSILERRRQIIKKMCAKYKSNVSKTITQDQVKNIFVEDKHKVLYCQVPKAGCSNWKRTLMVLAGVTSDPHSITHDTAHFGNFLKTLNSFDRQGIMRRLNSYTKVMFVREPFERVVSAYRDKFENPNDYYHKGFGRPIISKYRPNATRSALASGNGVTFQEFVQYLLDVHRPVGIDIHWEPANQLCNPCLIDYDFIGKFENMEEEADLLLRLVGAPRNLTLPKFKDRNTSDERTSLKLTQKYFERIGAVERQRVYDFYYMDYLMFNYSKPDQVLY